MLTRRYHGLLIAALDPAGAAGGPQSSLGARTLLVSKFDETLHYDSRSYELGANCWASGGPDPTIAPEGFRFIERFQLQGTTPVWTFACADALLEKRIWMADGSNTTYVRYDLVRASAVPAQLEIKALVNYRDFHSTTHVAQIGDSGRFQITPVDHGLRVIAGQGATPFYLLSDSAQAEPQHEWYLNFDLAEERFRGLDDREDHLLAGIFRGPAGARQIVDDGALNRRRKRRSMDTRLWPRGRTSTRSYWITGWRRSRGFRWMRHRGFDSSCWRPRNFPSARSHGRLRFR